MRGAFKQNPKKGPSALLPWIVASYMELGQQEQALAEVRKILELDSKFSTEKWGNRTLVRFQNQVFKERFLGNLLKAGLPE